MKVSDLALPCLLKISCQTQAAHRGQSGVYSLDGFAYLATSSDHYDQRSHGHDDLQLAFLKPLCVWPLARGSDILR